MFVDKLALKNFRKYESLEIEFKNKVSVIVGQNGSGKSTVLDAISYLISVCMDNLMISSKKNLKLSDVHQQKETLGELSNNKLYYPVVMDLYGCIDGVKYHSGISANQIESSMMYCTPNVSDELRKKLNNNSFDTLLPVICVYSAGRLWETEGINELTETTSMRENGYNSCLNAHLDSKSMNTWFEKMTYVELQKNTKLSTLQAVYLAIKKSFAVISESTNIIIETDLINHGLEISYEDKSNKSYKMALSQLSDGYRCTVSLIADIAYRMATLNPQLGEKVIEETDGIVLIDEVDLHLHPEWQQKILGVLTEVFPKVQFIVTTHAPAVINSVKSESLIILEDDIAREPYGEVYGKDVNTIISGIMGASERPEAVKVLFKDFYKAIDDNNLQNATEILSVIEKEIGNDDTELAGCRVKLSLLKFAGGSDDKNK